MVKGMDFINDSNEFFKKQHIVVKGNNEKEYHIEVAKKIKDTEINKVVSTLMRNAEYCNKKNKEYNVVVDMYAQILKLFTDINFNKYKDIGKQMEHDIQVCSAIVDIGVYDQIVKHFDEESIRKIEESFNTYKKSFKMINNQIISQVVKGDKDGEL